MIWLLAVICWCLCGLLAEKVGKPEEGRTNAILGFLLGPIGVVLAMFGQPKTDEPAVSQRQIERDRWAEYKRTHPTRWFNWAALVGILVLIPVLILVVPQVFP